MTETARILMVPDAYCGPDSGAVAARLAAGIWRGLGHEVAVYAGQGSASDDTRIYAAKPFRLAHHLAGGELVAHFESVIDDFHPTHVFFLGSAISKPTPLFVAARQRGLPRLCLWWTQDFFCTRGYGCLPEEGPCTRCLGGNGLHAIVHRCHYASPSYRKIVAGALARMIQRRELQCCDVVIGSSRAQLELYRQFGIPAERLVHCPLFFNRERVQGHVAKPGDYVVCYGQARAEKGWHLLASILHAAPRTKVVLPFSDRATAEAAVRRFGLQPFVDAGQVRVISGITWPTGVNRLVAESAGVLIPSIWPTTTEYVLLESLGLSKPVVAFDVGIHGEVIVSGDNGLLAPLGDTAAIAGQLECLVASSDLQTRLSTGAAELFAQLTAPDRYTVAFREALSLADGARKAGALG